MKGYVFLRLIPLSYMKNKLSRPSCSTRKNDNVQTFEPALRPGASQDFFMEVRLITSSNTVEEDKNAL